MSIVPPAATTRRRARSARGPASPTPEPTERALPFTHPHLATLHAALASERAWQEREHRAQLALSVEDRVAVGVSWAPVRITDVEPIGRGRRLVTVRSPGVLHEGIGAGDTVRLAPRADPDGGVVGRLRALDERVAEVVVDGPVELAGDLVATLRFDPSTFTRYAAALVRADGHRAPLAEALLGGEVHTRETEAPPLPGLNDAQRRAAAHALAAPHLAVIHGPPGTGKTTVIVAMLRVLAAREERAWALADSNAAVDHLALRADAAGLDVVRLGHPARIGSAAERLSVGARVAAGPLGPVLHRIDRELIGLHADAAWEVRQRRRALLEERDRLDRQARDAILSSADVVASTLGTLARLAHDLPRAHTAIVDEATQAIEPGIWVAVPWVERLILVGDPHQLGPVVVEPGNPLGRSLVDRLLDEAELPLPMLEVQHRMHQAIQDLLEPVYGRTYRPHPAVAAHLLRDLPDVADSPLTGIPALWIDTAGAGFDEEEDPVTRSLRNRGEARVVALAVELLRAAGVAATDIGIVAPYSAQVAWLRDVVPDVEVATVNAFQGREKEAIVVSFVRSNPDGTLGFVADRRRLTVALSRARRHLLCIGDTATLSSDRHLADVIERLQREGAWQTVWEEPWMDVAGW